MSGPDITFNEQRVDALRELANIGAGNSSAALERLVGRPIDVDLPQVELLGVADAIAAAGEPDEDRYGIVVGIEGGLEARLLILLDPCDAEPLFESFGLAPGSPEALSMLSELGNILCAHYVGSLARVAGLEVTLSPPQLVQDMLGAIFAAALIGDELTADPVVLLESGLAVADRECELTMVLIPQPGAIATVLERLEL